MTTFTHILYHANCADGFGAAYAAWKVLGDQATYLPVRHGDAPPDLPVDARVAVLDFSYPRQTLIDLHQQLAHFLVLDHHQSAQRELADLNYASFDLNKSGARMAWEFWHPQHDLPPLLEYIEDRDLWRWALPDSREVSLALQCYPMEFELWGSLSVTELRKEGVAIVRFQNQQIARAISRARLQELGEFTVPTVNSCLLQSEIGDDLCRLYPDAPFSAVYYTNQHNKQAWSLRSIGDFDVSEVAKLYGGGGHRNAAGFALPGTQ